MAKFLSFLFMIANLLLLQSCSRRTTPSKPDAGIENTTAKAPTYKAPVKTPVPKSITVNDKAASKSVDGRYYYDLEGKRYWRNNKDGKYYIYYKGMFDNKDFQ